MENSIMYEVVALARAEVHKRSLGSQRLQLAPYTVFCWHIRQKVIDSHYNGTHPGFATLGKTLGYLWNSMHEHERNVYIQVAKRFSDE